MALNYSQLLYGPAHALLGVMAVFLAEGSDAEPADIRVIDKTQGVPAEDSIGRERLVPVVVVEATALAGVGIGLDDLDGAQLSPHEDNPAALGGIAWTIKRHREEPSPQGNADGEVWLYLEKAPESS